MPTNARDVHKLIADKVSTGSVVDRVVDALTEKELCRRSDALINGLAVVEDLENQLKKVSRPDVEHFDAAGKPLPPVFSKEQANKIKSLNERIEKANAAISKAIDTGDFGNVYNLKKGGSGDTNADTSGGAAKGE